MKFLIGQQEIGKNITTIKINNSKTKTKSLTI